MILQESFSKEHIKALQEKSKRDPVLLERTIYAFGLLEALTKVNMPFVFKGGTCLMLLMDKPRRLSTDIDIIVAPGTDVDAYIDEASKIFPFKTVEEQKRFGKNNIEKRHFKFTYDSPINARPFYILLDILFENNHYSKLAEKEIKSEILLMESEPLKVKLPSANSILADKLTAFAPHTIGILLNKGKDMEVMKQFYDVTSLLEVFDNYSEILPTYKAIAKAEAEYRGLDHGYEVYLKDSFDAALCIAAKGKINPDEYRIYVKGIRDLRGHIYAENYSPEIAALRAPKIMYMIVCLLTGEQYEKVADFTEYITKQITSPDLTCLSYLRKVNAEAYAYAVKTDEIYSKMTLMV